jgi:transcriptional regulator with XRE-family HTH domain
MNGLTDMKIVTAIDKTIVEHKITRSQLAEMTGFYKTDVSKILNGRAHPTVDRVDMMIDALPTQAKIYFCWLLTQSDLDD